MELKIETVNFVKAGKIAKYKYFFDNFYKILIRFSNFIFIKKKKTLKVRLQKKNFRPKDLSQLVEKSG